MIKEFKQQMKKICLVTLFILFFVFTFCIPKNSAFLQFKVTRNETVTDDVKTYAFYYSETDDVSSFPVFAFVGATIKVGNTSASGKGHLPEGNYYLKFEQPYDTGSECGITINKVTFLAGETYIYEIDGDGAVIDDLNIHGTFTKPCN